MPNSTVRGHLTTLGATFAEHVQYFVDGFGPAPGAGHHFALRVHASATTEGVPIGGNGVEVGLTVSLLEIKNIDTGETAELTFSGVDVNAGVGLDAGPVDVAVGSGQWVYFDTVDAVRVEDFAGPARMPSIEVATQEFSLLVLPVNVDQEDLLGDLLRGDGVDISDATVDLPDLVSVSEKIGELHVTRVREGDPDHTRDLFSGPNVDAVVRHDSAVDSHPGDDDSTVDVGDPSEPAGHPGDDLVLVCPVTIPMSDDLDSGQSSETEDG